MLGWSALSANPHAPQLLYIIPSCSTGALSLRRNERPNEKTTHLDIRHNFPTPDHYVFVFDGLQNVSENGCHCVCPAHICNRPSISSLLSRKPSQADDSFWKEESVTQSLSPSREWSSPNSKQAANIKAKRIHSISSHKIPESR